MAAQTPMVAESSGLWRCSAIGNQQMAARYAIGQRFDQVRMSRNQKRGRTRGGAPTSGGVCSLSADCSSDMARSYCSFFSRDRLLREFRSARPVSRSFDGTRARCDDRPVILRSSRLALEPISPDLARRIVAREEQPGDNWHSEYPFADEVDPLTSLSVAEPTDTPFTMYLIRRTDDGQAVGGLGFFGSPEESGQVEFGYGLVPSARGAGLATEAVGVALEHASSWGARVAVADTAVSNLASQRVLVKNGLTEVSRDDALVYYRRTFASR